MIREATPDEIGALIPLCNRANVGGEHTQKCMLTALLLDPRKGFVLVAEDGGIVGCITVHYERSIWSGEVITAVSSMATTPNAPLRTAHALCYRALHLLFKEGVHKITFTTPYPNPMRFHEIMGAQPLALIYEGDVATGLANLKKRVE